jgi:aspartyl-tRNA(Asn)/glutamyl-tRNA(Gln) amidotransferase subunit C
MLEIKDIDRLAKLARIELTDTEKEKLLKDIDPILGYVTQIKEVAGNMDTEKKAPEHRNITRADDGVTLSGTNTEAFVANMPESEKNYLKVKKILNG